MKKFFRLMAWLAIAPLALASCESDDGDGCASSSSDITLQTPPYKEQAAKFSIPSGVGCILNGKTVTLTEVEFTESGNYLITYVDEMYAPATRAAAESLEEYLTGKFSIDSNGTYVLNGFAHIAVTVSGTKYSITISPVDGSGSVDVDVVKLDDVATSELTGYLCRTWTIENTRLRGTVGSGVNVARDFPGTCDINALIDYANDKGANIKDKVEANTVVDGITFTSAGTYLINYANGKKDVGTWKWTSQSTGMGMISYSWNSDDMGTSLDSGRGTVEFTGGNKCKLTLPAAVEGSSIEVVYTMH